MPLKQVFAFAFIIIMVCLLLCACGPEDEVMRESISIWCSSELASAADALEIMADEYNASLEEDAFMPVSIRRFEDEKSLAAAFDSIHPDLMLCSYTKAAELSERGGLTDISRKLHTCVEYSAPIVLQIPNAGSLFFPIGSETLLLLMNPSCFEDGAPQSFESLFSQADKFTSQYCVPFFSADSFSHIFYDSMLQLGTEFYAVKEKDIWNEDYKHIYNLIAEAAFSGSLDTDCTSGRDAVERGVLPCAVILSRGLADLGSAYAVSPLPDMRGGVKIHLAETFGLVSVADGDRRADSAAAFISWLNSKNRLSDAALLAGLVPASAAVSGWESCPLSDALMEVYAGYSLYLPTKGSSFVMEKTGFEEQLQQAFKVLS